MDCGENIIAAIKQKEKKYSVKMLRKTLLKRIIFYKIIFFRRSKFYFI